VTYVQSNLIILPLNISWDVKPYSINQSASISRQTRFSPTFTVERIIQHSIYLIKLPPSHLALAKRWNDNDPCKLHLISHHFITARLTEWSVSVKVGVRMSLAAGCSGPRHLFPTVVHCAVSVSVTLPLIVSLPLPMTRLQSRLMCLWLISGAALLIRYGYSSVSLSEWCSLNFHRLWIRRYRVDWMLLLPAKEICSYHSNNSNKSQQGIANVLLQNSFLKHVQ